MAEARDHSFPAFDAAALARHRDLMARMAASDGDALHLLYLELGTLVHGIARRILEDPEDAREAVQDTFIKVWRNAGNFDRERGEVVAWVVFIARNVAIDRVRQGARRRTLYESIRPEPIEPVAPLLGRIEAEEEVARRLGVLSANQRQALELAFFGGCTHAQIATAMQTPIGNVKNHLRRGLQRLRKLATRHE